MHYYFGLATDTYCVLICALFTSQFHLKMIKYNPFLILFLLIVTITCCNKPVSNSYQIEAINDPFFLDYPNPEPVHVVNYSFIVKENRHLEIINIDSKNLHNISISIENISDELIEDPYLTGPQGYDFRDLSKLVLKIVEGVPTEKERFIRLHEWLSYYYDRFETKNNKSYGYEDYYGNALRVINQYGGSMCGDAVHVFNGLLLHVPPKGSMYGRRVQLDGHQTGEAWFGGAWHNFDASPEIRWIYLDYGNETIVPHWKQLIDDDGELIKRINPMTGWDIWHYVKSGSGEKYYIMKEIEGAQWYFGYNLRPSEKFTMYYDMRGRTDQTSRNYSRSTYNVENPEVHRNPCDYASAVFSYRPDFTTELHKKYAGEENNIQWTSKGLIPKEKGKPASIVFSSKSTWNIVGADVSADFFTDGNVYFAVTDSIEDTAYSKNLKWIPLKNGKVFENNSAGIEGRMAYWVKFEFEGPNTGLKAAAISTEVQINKYTLPLLSYGKNHIRFSASNMNGGSAKVTYTYDEQSEYDFYEPATENSGRYIFYRVGGNHTKTWTKPMFYKNVKNHPDTLMPIKVEIFKAFGDDFGKKVRTLKDEPMKLGAYWWYWDGRDDAGNKCPAGMYSWKVTGEVGESSMWKYKTYGEGLYLFDSIWPQPNEIQVKRK